MFNSYSTAIIFIPGRHQVGNDLEMVLDDVIDYLYDEVTIQITHRQDMLIVEANDFNPEKLLEILGNSSIGSKFQVLLKGDYEDTFSIIHGQVKFGGNQ